MTMSTLLFLSDILHSKERPCCTTSSTNPNQSHQLIICHKDDPSLYKCTRKISRTSHRLLSNVKDCALNNIESCNGCTVVYLLTNDGGKNEAAILKRLESEFGKSVGCLPLKLGINEKLKRIGSNIITSTAADDNGILTLNALKFSSSSVKTTSGVVSSTSSSTNMSIVLFDLDSFVHSKQVDSDSTETRLSFATTWEIANEVLSTFSLSCQQSAAADSGKDNQEDCIVHIKCNILYQTIANMLSSISAAAAAAADGKPELRVIHVTKNDLEAHLKKQQQLISNDMNEQHNLHLTSETVVPIRRLRQKKEAAGCPLSIYPIRYIRLCNNNNNHNPVVEICRFYNYDRERGCLRSKRSRCELDHEHCHLCGERDHRAFECLKRQDCEDSITSGCGNGSSLEPMIFTEANGKVERSECSSAQQIPNVSQQEKNKGSAYDHQQQQQLQLSLPVLVVLGGRLRGKTLASCEALPLSANTTAVGNYSNISNCEWIKLPNLLEHRGSHAAASPNGTGLVFVMGGGGVDGNLDTVECLQCCDNGTDTMRWQTLPARLSAPRHAFGSVTTCTENNPRSDTKSISLFAVGGWKYGQVSCGSVDKLSFEYPCSSSSLTESQWEQCAPLIMPRRLHSVAASADERSIYVFGGYIDERHTTNSIEQYDIDNNKWSAFDALPYGDNCPLVQVILDRSSRSDNSFLIFPYGSGNTNSPNNNFKLLRYRPGADNPFAPILIPGDDEKELHLPLKNWAAFSVTSSQAMKKAYLVGGTIDGKWTDRGFELDLITMTWTELPAMKSARRRAVTLVLE